MLIDMPLEGLTQATCRNPRPQVQRVWEMDLAQVAYKELEDLFRRVDPTHERVREYFTLMLLYAAAIARRRICCVFLEFDSSTGIP